MCGSCYHALHEDSPWLQFRFSGFIVFASIVVIFSVWYSGGVIVQCDHRSARTARNRGGYCENRQIRPWCWQCKDRGMLKPKIHREDTKKRLIKSGSLFGSWHVPFQMCAYWGRKKRLEHSNAPYIDPLIINVEDAEHQNKPLINLAEVTIIDVTQKLSDCNATCMTICEPLPNATLTKETRILTEVSRDAYACIPRRYPVGEKNW